MGMGMGMGLQGPYLSENLYPVGGYGFSPGKGMGTAPDTQGYTHAIPYLHG